MTTIVARAGANAFANLDRNRLAHGYLFSGPEGSGKNHFAQQLAKAILCNQAVSPIVACQNCTACAMVDAGTHPDFICHEGELKIGTTTDTDAVDAVTTRSLISRLALHGYSGSWRVVVAADIIFASPEAANALLKLIEEPPDNVIFIFTTSQPNTLLPTIVSRLVTIPFRAFSNLEIKMILQTYNVDEQTATEATALADGNLDLAIALIENGETAVIRRGAVNWFIDALCGHNPDATFLDLENKTLTTRDKRLRLLATIAAIKQTARDWSVNLAFGSDVPSLVPEAQPMLGKLERNAQRAKAALESISTVELIARTNVPIHLVLAGLQYRLQIA